MKKIKFYMVIITLLILTGCASTAKCDAYGDNTNPLKIEKNDA